MGAVVRFPEERRVQWGEPYRRREPAEIVILPVVRIERRRDDYFALGTSPEVEIVDKPPPYGRAP